MRETHGEPTSGQLTRRQVLAAAGSVSVPLVAGCSEGGGGDGGATATPTETPTETQTATPTPTPTATESMDVPGETASRVDPLSIVEHRPRVGYFGQTDQTYFPVEVTVENGGDQMTDVMEYYYNVVAYDADGNDVTGDQSGSSSTTETDIDPGSQATFVVYSTLTVQPGEVARYEVTIRCESTVTGFEAEGVYCQ